MRHFILSFIFGLFLTVYCAIASAEKASCINAADFGFLPTSSGVENVVALQKAVDIGGTIYVTQPGVYKIASTVYIGDNTSLVFGNGVILEKSAEQKVFSHVFLNKGALTRTYNHHIEITGLNLRINNVDLWMDQIYGLRGHVAFFYVKDLKIERFRCTDIGKGQFCLHICTFEDLLINDAIMKGKKDGIHFGPGKRFRISNVVFQTADDAIALVPGDWVSANPEYGNLEDGIIENCTDIPDDYLEGAFVKIVGSGWVDWKPGIEVRQGTAVVSNGRIYRVAMDINGKVYKSTTRPDFESGMKVLDGINWIMFQNDTIHTAAVRNVVFRDIYLYGIRVPFQLMCYGNDYEHSYYPGAQMPIQGNISLENIYVLNDNSRPLVSISSPCDILNIRNTTFRNNSVAFQHSVDFKQYPPTFLNIYNCTFTHPGTQKLIQNISPGKEIYLKTSGNIEVGKGFSAEIEEGPGRISVDSDLTGLRK